MGVPGVAIKCLKGFLFALSNLCLLSPPLLHAADTQAVLFSTDNYRIDEFRAPVPDSVPGARTLDTQGVQNLIEAYSGRVVLIDVLPSPPKPANLSPTALWLAPSRKNIPGSLWLPNVGYGRISGQLDNYFQSHLHRASEGDPDHPIVIYCLADCWMSWNAAQRAARYGYRRVYWYPEGTTAWEGVGLPTSASEPELVLD